MTNLFSRIVWLLLLLPLSLVGKANTDSLSIQYQQLLLADLEPKPMIDTLKAFAMDNLYLDDSLAFLAMGKVLEIAEEQGYTMEQGIALSLMSWREEKFGTMQKALNYALEAIEILKNEQPGHTLIWTYNHLSWVSRRLMEKGKAMEYAMQALLVAEQTADTSNMGSAYNNIAALYVELQDYDKALEYHRQALHWRQLAGNSIGIAQSHGNMGIVYMRLKRYDEALEAHKRGLKVAQESNSLSEIAFFYNDIGSTYLYKGNTDSSIHYLKESVAMREDMKETNEIAYTYNYLGEAYEKAGNIREGERWIKKALQMAIDIHNSKQHYEALESLAGFYARNNRYDSAYVYLSKHKLYGDSINETRRETLIDELATQYETEKKEQQIEILNQETAIQHLRLRQRGLFLLAALGVILAGVVTVYFIFKQRKLKAEARLQQEINRQQEQATRAVLDAEERERRRIASDLHDGVGQILSAALLNLNYMNKSVQEGELPDTQVVDNALQLVKDSYDEMRSISHQMMPNALLKAGLASSIKEFLDKIDSKQMKVDLDVIGLDERLDGQTETVLYRTIQEAVNNVVKHAGASKLTIQLVNDDEGMSVTVEDNGQGFDTRNLDEYKGIGLKNIRSRVALLNGTVEVDSSPGRGTLVAIHIPN